MNRAYIYYLTYMYVKPFLVVKPTREKKKILSECMGGEKCEILQGCIKQSCQKWETFPSFFFSRTMLQQNSQFNTLLLLYSSTTTI